jgi:predicted nuclease of predicted toxin-antitoxin system
MKFLLDACASSRSMRGMLVRRGHDVVSVADRDLRASDVEVLAMALEEGRILITEDKDFGELVFVRGLPYSCIIRFVDMRVEEKLSAMRSLLEREADSMLPGVLIVVTRSRVRVRRGRLRERGGGR